MPKAKGKKITAGSVVGLLVVVALFIAQQKGWLPQTGGPDSGNDTQAAQNDRQHETQAPDGGRNTPADTQERIDPEPRDTPRNTGRVGTASVAGGDGGIGELFLAERSDVVVTASGIVRKVLPDDNDGSRHQKLIVTLSTGATVLIAHNIDLAERVPCDEGDLVKFRGEYEWSQQGGVIHWTHHDPAGRHQPGWIEYQGVRYE